MIHYDLLIVYSTLIT